MPAPNGTGPYFPVWQISPYIEFMPFVNSDAKHIQLHKGAEVAMKERSMVIDGYLATAPGGIDSPNRLTQWISTQLSVDNKKYTEYQGDPISRVYFPVYDAQKGERSPVASIFADIHWASYFSGILPSTSKGIDVVLKFGCMKEPYFTYRINGEEVHSVGFGDLHDPSHTSDGQFSNFSFTRPIVDGTKEGMPLLDSHCEISIAVYPTSSFFESFETKTPFHVTAAVASIFLFTVLLFIVYDRLVERRQALVMFQAKQTSDIVTSLFPESVRDRLIQAEEVEKKRVAAPTARLKSFLKEAGVDDDNLQPIADLFPNCTVMFADIAGFTAWSSSRDPAHVFILLQTVYREFDKIAKRRNVFKVETIGDTYLAVTGLPEPQPNHAIIMARFAQDCRNRMNEVTAVLEKSLGPDTADLTMRFGLHSGPVTAGVLRGDRARFQLFGDTVNTAARMER